MAATCCTLLSPAGMRRLLRLPDSCCRYAHSITGVPWCPQMLDAAGLENVALALWASVGQPQPTMVGHPTPAYLALHCIHAVHMLAAAVVNASDCRLFSVHNSVTVLWRCCNGQTRLPGLSSSETVWTTARPSAPANCKHDDIPSSNVMDADAPCGADGARHRGVRAGVPPPPRCRGAAASAVQRRVCRPRRRCCVSTLLSGQPF